MRFAARAGLAVVLGGCAPAPANGRLDSAHAAAMADSVRQFAGDIAAQISKDGPAAWRNVFLDTSAFFMASEGRLVFPDNAAAMRAVDGLTKQITRMELRWGPDLRVQPLAPGIAQFAASYHETRTDSRNQNTVEDGFLTATAVHRGATWRLLNAHWSVAGAPPAVP